MRTGHKVDIGTAAERGEDRRANGCQPLDCRGLTKISLLSSIDPPLHQRKNTTGCRQKVAST
jgi:hypothetical protein